MRPGGMASNAELARAMVLEREIAGQVFRRHRREEARTLARVEAEWMRPEMHPEGGE